MSGRKSGVQALLKEYSTNLIFVHCRSHLLELVLVQAADHVTVVKRVLVVVNKLYSMFQHSPKRLAVLEGIQTAVNGVPHKLIQAGPTRWLSYDGSIAIVRKHYAALCLLKIFMQMLQIRPVMQVDCCLNCVMSKHCT